MPKSLPAQIETEIYKIGYKPRIGIEIDYWSKNYAVHTSFIVEGNTYADSTDYVGSDVGILSGKLSDDFVDDGVKIGDILTITSASVSDMLGEYVVNQVDNDEIELDDWDSSWETNLIYSFSLERRYDGIVSGGLSIQHQNDREDGRAKISQIDFSVINQALESAMMQSNDTPENSYVYVYLYCDDGTPIQLLERIELTRATIQDIPDMTDDLLNFTIEPDVISDNLNFPPVITDDDFDTDDYGTPANFKWQFKNNDVLGETKKIIYGDFPFNYGIPTVISTDTKKTHTNINLIKCNYMGTGAKSLDWSSFYYIHYASYHNLKSFNITNYYTWCKLSDGQFAFVFPLRNEASTDETFLETAIDSTLTTFNYPDTEVDSLASINATVSNPEYAGDGNCNTNAVLTVTDDLVNPSASVTLNFNNLAGITVPSGSQEKIYIVMDLSYTISFPAIVRATINSIVYTLLPTTTKTAILVSTLSSFNLTDDIKLELIGPGTNSGGVATLNVYCCTKNLEFDGSDYIDPDEIYIACQGIEDDASGTYTGTANALIQNPADVMHDMIRRRANVSSDKVNASSFTSARTELSSLDADFIIDEQSTLGELLEDIGSDFQSTIRIEDGKYEIQVYDDTAPFSVSGTDTPGDKDIYEYSPAVSSGSLTNNMIYRGSLSMNKTSDDVVTRINLSYFYQNSEDKFRKEKERTDTSTYAEDIPELQESKYITDESTAQSLADHRLNLRSRKKWEVTFTTGLHGGVRLQEWDVINIWHRLIESVFGTTEMNSKKWLVIPFNLNASNVTYNITAIEL